MQVQHGLDAQHLEHSFQSQVFLSHFIHCILSWVNSVIEPGRLLPVVITISNKRKKNKQNQFSISLPKKKRKTKKRERKRRSTYFVWTRYHRPSLTSKFQTLVALNLFREITAPSPEETPGKTNIINQRNKEKKGRMNEPARM